ncbi:condensation domain-containing protein, partial [Aestuariimicrobium ganziense]|uniref:condensation domain-containing protein n=1 Tax=Aestuariimicrobium ganziense TaxID=2773677 RepID=UPI001942A673
RLLASEFARRTLLTGAPPTSALELALATIWRDVLGTEPEDTSAHFQVLGGDSLAAAHLASELRACLGVSVPAAFVLDHPTLAAQAHQLHLLGADPEIERDDEGSSGHRERPNQAPAWPLQEYFHAWSQAIDPVRVVLPVTAALRVRDSVDVMALADAVAAVVARHDALRTGLQVVDGQLQQMVAGRARMPVNVVEVPDVGDQQAREQWVRDDFNLLTRRPFDIAAPVLGRVVLYRLGPSDSVLLVTISHMVIDGASLGIVLRDLGIAYAAALAGRPVQWPLPAPSAALLAHDEAADHERTVAYWRQQLADVPAHPGAPTGLAHSAVRVPEFHEDEIPVELAARLDGAARRLGATPFMLLLAAWTSVLPPLAGVDDVVVASPVAARGDRVHADTVGCLARNTLLRVRLHTARTFADVVTQVRDAVFGAVEHQRHPLEQCRQWVPHVSRVNVEDIAAPQVLPGISSERFDQGHGEPMLFVPDDGIDLRVPDLLVRVAEGPWQVTLMHDPDWVTHPAQICTDFIEALRDGVDDPHRPRKGQQ